MNPLRVSILQTDIDWEDKQANLRRLREKLENLRGTTEIAVLPETFSTGFSMQAAHLAESDEGETIRTLRNWAVHYGIALTGSYIASENNNGTPTVKPCHNRAFFLTPEGDAYFCDKRHLFRMGHEDEHFAPGQQRLVFNYREWNILLLVCYDLRFPVWSRNVNNEYDLLIYVANWPTARRHAWDILLQARALENVCYVCGVNRIGTDGHNIAHNGGSVVLSPKATVLASVPDGQEAIATATLDLDYLKDFRKKFPTWKDADRFLLNP